MQRLKRLFSLSTTKDVIINSVGNYLSVFFTALYAPILVRAFTPTEYGIFSVLFAIAYLLANILDFGVTASIYSYLPGLLGNREETLRFIKANFLFQTVLSFLVLIIGFVFVNHLDTFIFKLNVPTSYYFWTFVSIPLFIWQNFILNIFFASKRFLHANILNNISYFSKVVMLLVLVYLDKVTVQNVIITFGILGQLVFFALLFREKRWLLKELIYTPFHRAHIKLEYTLTFFAASQLFNLASRIDLFMLSFFLIKSEVGYYGLSQKIILTVLTMVNSITQVISPQFSNIKTQHEVKSLIKKGLIYMLIPTGIFVAIIILPTWVYTFIFTDKFVKTAAITRVLSGSFILYGLTAVPTLFFLYTIKKPRHLLVMNFIFLIIVAVGCLIMIPIKGVFGPPIAFVTAFIIVTFYIVGAFAYEYRQLKN